MVVMPADRTNQKKEFVRGALHGLGYFNEIQVYDDQTQPGLLTCRRSPDLSKGGCFSSKGSLTIDQASVLKRTQQLDGFFF